MNEAKMKANLRSQRVLTGPEGSIQRTLYKSMGYTDYDLERPLVGIANSWNRVVPGHYNLQLVAEYVKQGVLQAGGTPVEFGVIAACDGIAQGHVGMHYILPTRDLIANDVEMMAQAHQFDGLGPLGFLRQDRARHADGGRPARPAGHPSCRRTDGGRLPVRRPGLGHHLAYRGARHAQGGQNR